MERYTKDKIENL